jgi:hypothetical protein
MTQHAMTIANQAGGPFRADLNNALLALVTQSAGVLAPATTYAYQCWADTTSGMLKQRNSSNSAWITLGALSDLGIQSGAQVVSAAGGTADALTASFSPAITAFVHGMVVRVRATAANATTTPTFTPNSGTLAVKTIVKGNNLPLAAGDIAGAGHWVELQRDNTLDVWVLNNPATGITSATTYRQLTPLTASVAANALTTSLASGILLDFRSATLSSGAVTAIRSNAISLVAPNGATLGTVSGVQSRLVVLAINASGTIELAITNISGGTSLDEMGLISTTAVSAGATSAGVVYSTTARSNVAYRVLGVIDSTQVTAGAWAAAPSTVQGSGGQAISSLGSIGFGQTWQSVTGSRSPGTTYYNSTGKPISVSVSGNNASVASQNATINVNGAAVAWASGYAGGQIWGCTAIVPPGASYSVTMGGTYTAWSELR